MFQLGDAQLDCGDFCYYISKSKNSQDLLQSAVSEDDRDQISGCLGLGRGAGLAARGQHEEQRLG